MKTLNKSIFTVLVALACFTIAQAQEENPQARTEGKLKGKIIKGGDNGMISVSDENQETPITKKGWDGTIKGGKIDETSDVAQRKGITEGGLKKNEPMVTESRGIDKKDIRRASAVKSNPLYEGNNQEGENPLHGTQRKGINEKGLKKNDAEISTTNSEKKGLNAVNVKLSKSNSEQASDLIDDANPTPQGHAVKTKGSGATSGPDVKPIKVEETKIGQPHP